MPSLVKLQKLSPSSTDAKIYAAYEVPAHARKFNPIKTLRERIPYDMAAKTKKKAKQFIQFDLYIHYNTEDCDDPAPSELAAKIKELKSMDQWKRDCSDNILCQNYRTNIRNYQAQLRRIKKHGRKTNLYPKYGGKALKALFQGLQFRHMLNDVIQDDSKYLSFKFTPSSIRSVEKVPKAFINKYYGHVSFKGSVWRLRCRCVVTGPASKSATAESISHRFALFDWLLQHSIASWLTKQYEMPYRGSFDVAALQIHNGEPPAYFETHMVRLSKTGSLEEVMASME
jgi:hypothetical protein